MIFLKTRESSKPGDIWESLSDEQKKEVLVSYEESEDAKNLIALKEVIKRAK